MMPSSALSTLFPKMKGAPSIEVGDMSTYQTDVYNKPLLICMIVMAAIILTYLMRPRSKRKHKKTTSDETQTLTTITDLAPLYIFKKLEI